MDQKNTAGQFERSVRDIMWEKFGIEPEDADRFQIYYAVSEYVKRTLAAKYHYFETRAKEIKAKRVCYLSMEFLVGRSLKNDLFNLEMMEEFQALAKKCEYAPEEIYNIEKDPGLGNGGLGRLAASYLDAMATLSYRGEGYSILYEYGLFKQYFRDGEQIELPDKWLDTGDVWLSKNNAKRFTVKVCGEFVKEDGKDKYVNYRQIIAEGYDMFIPGYKSSGVTRLKLWKALPSDKFDMKYLLDGRFDAIVSQRGSAELISMFLYPPDGTEEGKKLRLLQQYFFVSATVQSVVSEHYREFREVEDLHEHVCFHINDTHPALCIPELVRVLTEDYGVKFEKSLEIVEKAVTYTNHTVMPEALEVWDDSLLQELIPRIYLIIKEIDRIHSSSLYSLEASSWERATDISVISSGNVKMANMSVICSSKVNGVSALHTRILKDTLFCEFAERTPDKFLNVTNGISYRRWLCQSNPYLSSLLDETIGNYYKERPYELASFAKYANDKYVIEKIEQARRKNKEKLSQYAKQITDRTLDPESMFDVQIKRLHEYKRQLLNALKIMTYYCEIVNNPNADISPKTFIFAAKAAPSYHHAKRVIKLINKLSGVVYNDARTRDILNVIFLPDYNVSLSEKIIPATDLSEQISLAGKEASGTGNMKFMLNGALTIGTYDGANVEITELVGEDNIYIFGMRAEEVPSGPMTEDEISAIIREDARLSDALSLLRSDVLGDDFSDIYDYLTAGSSPDPYFCLRDYSSYLRAYRQACVEFKNKRKHYAKSIINTANSGYFASDRAIEEYALKIWGIKCVK